MSMDPLDKHILVCSIKSYKVLGLQMSLHRINKLQRFCSVCVNTGERFIKVSVLAPVEVLALAVLVALLGLILATAYAERWPTAPLKKLLDAVPVKINRRLSAFANSIVSARAEFVSATSPEKFLNAGFVPLMFTTADKIRFDRMLSGDAEIDARLPIYTQAIYTLYGKPGAGKSNIALAYCATAMQQGHNCIWIDTEGKFPASRLEQIAKARGIADWQQRFLYARVTNVRDFINAVRSVYKGEVSGKVVVVDTVINAFRQDPEYQGLKNLAKRQQTLSSILGMLFRTVNRTNSVAFTITHSMEAVTLGRDKHVGGHVLAHQTRILRVEVGQNSNTRSIITEKLPDMPTIIIPFMICDYGICYAR